MSGFRGQLSLHLEVALGAGSPPLAWASAREKHYIVFNNCISSYLLNVDFPIKFS